MVHNAALNRLQVIVWLGLYTRRLDEREEDVESDLKLAMADLCQSLVVSCQDLLGLLPDEVARAAHSPIIITRPIAEELTYGICHHQVL